MRVLFLVLLLWILAVLCQFSVAGFSVAGPPAPAPPIMPTLVHDRADQPTSPPSSPSSDPGSHGDLSGKASGDDTLTPERKRAILSQLVGDDQEMIAKPSLDMLDVAAKTDMIELRPATVTTNKRWVLISAICKTNVHWFITHDGKNPPIESLQIPGLPFILVFPNNIDEEINVFAYTGDAHGPSDLVKSVIQSTKQSTSPGTGPGPGTEPTGPVPTPLPPGSVVHFTIIHSSDAEKTNPRLGDLVFSTDIINGLKARHHFRWIMDRAADADVIATKGFDTYMIKVNKLPMYIIQDDVHGNVVDFGVLQGTPQDILALVDRVAPPAK